MDLFYGNTKSGFLSRVFGDFLVETAFPGRLLDFCTGIQRGVSRKCSRVFVIPHRCTLKQKQRNPNEKSAPCPGEYPRKRPQESAVLSVPRSSGTTVHIHRICRYPRKYAGNAGGEPFPGKIFPTVRASRLYIPQRICYNIKKDCHKGQSCQKGNKAEERI